MLIAKSKGLLPYRLLSLAMAVCLLVAPSALAADEAQQSNGKQSQETMDKLRKLQQALQEKQRAIDARKTKERCKTDSSSINDFVNRNWDLGGIPVIVNNMCMDFRSLGNHLGQYIEDVACANLTGAHFMTINRVFDGAVPEVHAGHGRPQRQIQWHQEGFFKALPDLILHPNGGSKSIDATIDLVKLECHCRYWCWGAPESAWGRSLPLVRTLVRGAVDEHLKIKNEAGQTALEVGTVLRANIDMVSSNPTGEVDNTTVPMRYPLLPDVAIQYRCSDNIGHGFLPFEAINKRIPDNAELIMILSEHPKRGYYEPNDHFPAIATGILRGLMMYIKERHRSSTVLVIRGEDPLLSFMKLTLAKTTICSPSTFCLWPAIASNGTAYMPKAGFIGPVDLGSHVTRTDDEKMTKPPQNETNLQDWLDVLEGRRPLPS
jgi:hypothetical protein